MLTYLCYGIWQPFSKSGSLKRNSDETSDTTVKVLRVDGNSSSSVNNVTESQEDVADVIAKSSKETPPQSCETRHHDYIQFVFFRTGKEEDPKPHCVLCYETLANKAMKPAILKRHLETKHKQYQGKPIGFFERKRDELKKHMMKETSQFFAPGENAKATEASYKVSLLIAEAGKLHSIDENLVKPAAKVMANILFGGKAGDEINRIPLSNDTVQRRIKGMAESFFSLQLDESIDLGNEANLLCFVRYIYAAGLHDEFLFCRSLPTNTTGEAIFHSLNDFIGKNNWDWSRCVRICTDGETSMTGKQKGLIARIRTVAPSAATHCCIHREQLAVKKMPQCLKSVLDESVKIVNKFKAKPLNSRLFKAVCEEMGSEHTKLLFHPEVRWLSHGKVLTRLFELMHDFQWLAKLAYLADIFSTLNTLNVALQGKTVTIFNVQDKIKATRLKMESWCGRLDRREFDSFPTLTDFLLAAGEDVDGSTVASFKQHLQDLHLQLEIYFPGLDASFDWIRNPFGDKTHIEQFTSKLSPREVDSLVDIHPELADSALKLLMPFPTYNCEVGFSTLVGLKTKQHNRISVLEPDIASLMAQKKQHHSSH
uniref:DUF4371 domain-containing protein n=1 Tax=Oryzias latipes TaxID=8090 RepID=A0A3P9JCN2_ORYLA